MTQKSIKIYYHTGGDGLPAETGWATVVRGQKVRIDNIPIFSDYHGGDIVWITKEEDNFPSIIKLVKRTHPHKYAIKYTQPDDFKTLAEHCKTNNWLCEGGFGPSEDRPGLLQICCNENNIEELLEQLTDTATLA